MTVHRFLGTAYAANQGIVIEESVQRACGAGESIKPRVERSGTLGNIET
jgi:hypothetical protein